MGGSLELNRKRVPSLESSSGAQKKPKRMNSTVPFAENVFEEFTSVGMVLSIKMCSNAKEEESRGVSSERKKKGISMECWRRNGLSGVKRE